jgi:aspartate/methionine/tyrosine aminotransferase
MDRARRDGLVRVDLSEANPTRCGLGGDAALVSALGHARGAVYDPSPKGHAEARRAVAAYYAERGLTVDPEQVLLTASTSEAYGWLFKLLCDPGDAVLVPEPSYPLFELLARLEAVQLLPYPLRIEEDWRVDLDALERSVDERTRALLLVHPNNPTGSLVRVDEATQLETIAERRGLSLVVDEVFGDYVWPGRASGRLASFVGPRRALTFVLSGLSKVLALPQLKLGWMVVLGPQAERDEALRRLEVVADTYLSVGTPVQRALPELLAARADVQRRILDRVLGNARVLDEALSAAGGVARRLPADAGWYAVIEVPRTENEDAWVLRLLAEDGLLVHPGWFFDMPRDGFLVISLLPEPEPFAAAARALAERLR